MSYDYWNSTMRRNFMTIMLHDQWSTEQILVKSDIKIRWGVALKFVLMCLVKQECLSDIANNIKQWAYVVNHIEGSKLFLKKT